MDITTRWILGVIGVITCIAGAVMIAEGFVSLTRKRNLVRKTRLAGEKYDHYNILYKQNEIKLSKLYAGKFDLYGSDVSLNAAELSNSELYKINLELKLFETKYMYENKLDLYALYKPTKYIEIAYLKNVKLVERAEQRSILESKISKLKVDVDAIESLDEKRAERSLDTLG